MPTTVAHPTIKAKYAHLYDESVTIARVNGVLLVMHDGGRIEDFAIDMAPFTTVLGDVQTAELQAMWDRVGGGPARIACTRQEGRQ